MRGHYRCVLAVFAIPVLLVVVAVSRGRAATTETTDKTDKKSAQIGKQIEDFSLRDYRGVNRALKDARGSKLVVVVFMGTECPLARLYAPRLNKLNADFSKKGVAFVAIDSNQQDSPTDITKYAKANDIKFPILKDVGNIVADRFGAERTPEAFVLDQNRKIQYQGRIDDQYEVGVHRSKAGQNNLADAIQDLLGGKPVSTPVTEATGCHIGRVRKPKPDGEITYSKHVSHILQKHCVECHRAGSIAPFSLTSYEDAVGWADTITEVIAAGRMPPWNANPEYGHFSNEARLSDDEKQQISQWIKDGVPQGSSSDRPEPKKYVEGWQIPKPSKVFFMRDKPFDVPAEGKVDYKHFEVDPGFKEDKWVTAAECVPGNRSVVHHIIVHVKSPKASKQDDQIESDWLCATAAGAPPMILPDGVAKRIPAGSKLSFQMHYTPNGTPQKDRSSVGLVFVDPSKVKKEAGTWKAWNTHFSIPAGEADHVVESSSKMTSDMLLLSMFPHMHLRGKSFRYEARYPDGKTEILLDVPRYDFNWQHTYILAEPKRLPAGTEVHCTAHFDNSAKNPVNPDAASSVKWGEQTWEEMMIGYFNVVKADQELKLGKSRASR